MDTWAGLLSTTLLRLQLPLLLLLLANTATGEYPTVACRQRDDPPQPPPPPPPPTNTATMTTSTTPPPPLPELPPPSCPPSSRPGRGDAPASKDPRCGFKEKTDGECWASIKRRAMSSCCPGAAGPDARARAAAAFRAAAQGRPIFGYYHVGLPAKAVVGGAASARIYAQQMGLLNTCGLAAASESIFVGVSLPQHSRGRRANESSSSAWTEKVLQSLRSSTLAPKNAAFGRVDGLLDAASESFEAATLKVMHDDVLAGRVPRHALIYYIHSKGGSGKTLSVNVVLWRRYMEYHILENPQWCLARLSRGDPGAPSWNATCGVDWAGNHYSGNFWFSTAEHIAHREPPDTSGGANYVAAEVWVGKRTPGTKMHHNSLCDSRFSLYKYPIHREFYAAAQGAY